MFGNLWSRIKAFFCRPLPAQAAGAGPIRGRRRGSSWRGCARDGAVDLAARATTSSTFPRGHARWRSVAARSCSSTAAGRRRRRSPHGTRIAALADDLGCLVLLPRQNPRANAWGCWNWFDRGDGRAAGARPRSSRRRSARCGASTGSTASACSSPGCRPAARSPRCSACGSPELVAGVFVHSGIACGAASSPLAALGVMKRGADTDVARDRARRARRREAGHAAGAAARDPRRRRRRRRAGQRRAARPAVPALNGHPGGGRRCRRRRSRRRIARDVATTPDARTVTTSEWRVARPPRRAARR